MAASRGGLRDGVGGVFPRVGFVIIQEMMAIEKILCYTPRSQRKGAHQTFTTLLVCCQFHFYSRRALSSSHSIVESQKCLSVNLLDCLLAGCHLAPKDRNCRRQVPRLSCLLWNLQGFLSSIAPGPSAVNPCRMNKWMREQTNN